MDLEASQGALQAGPFVVDRDTKIGLRGQIRSVWDFNVVFGANFSVWGFGIRLPYV